jgi:hypothetical protein
VDSELDQDPALTKFLIELGSIPWFSNIGKSLPADTAAKQLRRWEDWPGPEEPTISELHERQQVLYEDMMAESEGRRKELLELWDRVHKTALTFASLAVPYDPDQDAWHGPTMAVWQAAWTAGLIAWCIYLRRPIPKDLQEQWKWFVLGHWPSGYSVVWANDRLGPLLVY